jgi:hypothetical protein
MKIYRLKAEVELIDEIWCLPNISHTKMDSATHGIGKIHQRCWQLIEN